MGTTTRRPTGDDRHCSGFDTSLGPTSSAVGEQTIAATLFTSRRASREKPLVVLRYE
jgi:hypothetical protein